MVVDYVQEINVAVLPKVRVERKAKQTVIAPIANFFADIDQRRSQTHIVLENPDPAIPIPLEQRADLVKGDSDKVIPITTHVRFSKTAW